MFFQAQINVPSIGAGNHVGTLYTVPVGNVLYLLRGSITILNTVSGTIEISDLFFSLSNGVVLAIESGGGAASSNGLSTGNVDFKNYPVAPNLAVQTNCNITAAPTGTWALFGEITGYLE